MFGSLQQEREKEANPESRDLHVEKAQPDSSIPRKGPEENLQAFSNFGGKKMTQNSRKQMLRKKKYAVSEISGGESEQAEFPECAGCSAVLGVCARS